MAEGKWYTKQTVQVRYEEIVTFNKSTTYTLQDTYKMDKDFANYVTAISIGEIRQPGTNTWYDVKRMDNAQLVHHFLNTLNADDQKDWLINRSSDTTEDTDNEESVYDGLYCTSYTDREWLADLARLSDTEEDE